MRGERLYRVLGIIEMRLNEVLCRPTFFGDYPRWFVILFFFFFVMHEDEVYVYIGLAVASISSASTVSLPIMHPKNDIFKTE